jgi:ABC-type Fe3+-hydroxamate transport system substrate-binding protein
MPIYYDQLGRAISLPSVPKRIISVVPSQTELLFYLGLKKEIIGITKFCIYPANKFKSTAKIGGTKTLSIDKIKWLKPDLIIANKEENDQNQIEDLAKICPVWISDVNTLEDAIEMIERVGAVTGKIVESTVLSKAISQKFNEINIQPLNLRAAYFIWRKPYMVAGKNTFIDDMLHKCGLINAFDIKRYPEVYAGTIVDARPDVILLSSEPYPFKDRHFDEFKAMLPNVTVKIVDGEMFSWYGSRLLKAPEYFRELNEWVAGGIGE